MQRSSWLVSLPLAAALGLLATLLEPNVALAANGQQCRATSTSRGQFCRAPLGGFPNQAQCVAAYNNCLNNMDRLMHLWCVQIDQPNCDRNDDCPEGADCHVHPVNQVRRINTRCALGAGGGWSFQIFDDADCKCDCSDGAYPVPPEGPEGITAACDSQSLDCSSCLEPGEGQQACAGEPVAWGQAVPGSPSRADRSLGLVTWLLLGLGTLLLLGFLLQRRRLRGRAPTT